MKLFITYVHVPIGIKLLQKGLTDGPRLCVLVSPSVSWEQEKGALGEWAQSEGQGVPGAEH